MKRREFIQTSAFTTAGLLSLPSFLKAGKVKGELGLQLYTVRSSIGNDPKGVLQKIASFGYKEIETYSYADSKIFGMPFSEFGAYVKGLGMKVVSGHYGLDIIRGNAWEKAVTDAKAIGQKYMIMPYLVDSERKSIDNYKKICESLNKAGEVCNRYGIRFGYHNHAFEFDQVDGKTPFDVILAELDPKYVGMEMDIYWLVKGGKDPIQNFEKYPGRF
jgi:sugar phosphate isomerase/epimerase